MILTLAAIVLSATATVPPAPKNVILLVADGTGVATMTLARNVRGEQFRIGTMPVIGLYTTHCADRNVTDSAAGATALATGQKTNYGMLSLDPGTLAPVPTVLEGAERIGKATGLVTTAKFWDATPAAFAAHIKYRHDPGVDEQVLRSGADVVAGTGIEVFGKDGRPPLDQLAARNGYTLVTSGSALGSATGEKVLAVFPSQEREADFPDAPLPVLTRWAIERLATDPDGFFLLVEHEGTDGASHQNHMPDLRKAIVSFDEAVGVALDFAAKRGDTLVLVASDHETGGIRVTETRDLGRFRIEWSTTDHTASAVAVFAYGPGSAAFAGFQDNTDVGKKLKAAVLATP